MESMKRVMSISHFATRMILGGTLLIHLASCGGDSGDVDLREFTDDSGMVFAPGSEGLARLYVGEVPSLHAFIAVSETPTFARAYISDGVEDRATLSDWFKGSSADGRFLLSSTRTDGLFSNSLQLEAAVTNASATGTVRLADGSAHPFEIPRAGAIGGPYGTRATLSGEDHLLGIILLDDGRHLGAIINTTSVNYIGTIDGDLASTRHGDDKTVPVTIPPQSDGSRAAAARADEPQATRGGVIGTQYLKWWDWLPLS